MYIDNHCLFISKMIMDKPMTVSNLGACPMSAMNMRETMDERRCVTGACSLLSVSGKDLLSTGPTDIHINRKMEPRVVPIPEWHPEGNNISVGNVFGKIG